MRLFRRQKKKTRVCVVGLDGVPCSLLRRLADEGVLPRIAKILKLGHLRSMKASLPEISAVSWPSFMTGANPGRHGIFGFTDFKDNSYEFRVLSSADVQAPTIWDKLGAKGRRSVVINQPSTYPARKIDGTLISGFVAIEMRKAVFPLRLLGKLVREGYTIDVNAIECRENPHRLKAELQEMLASRRKALDLLWDEEDWDYLELVVTGTDRLHHFLWDALDGESHPYHDMFIDYYREVDMLVGDIFDRFQRVNMSDEAGQGFYMLSDHGFTGIRQEVYINRWLQENGYLEFDTETPESLGAVTGATRAFALDPARIYVNTRDRFQRGTVDADDVPDVVEEIKSAAMELEFEGSPVVKWAFARDEIYSGPCTSQGPDLVLVPNDGFDLKGSVKEKQVFGRSNLQGMHTWENAMFWSQQGVETDDLKISDLAEVILSEFND